MVHGRKLGLDKPFLGEIAKRVMEVMGDVYPDILQKREFILRTILQEEESFGQTLQEGTNRFNQLVNSLGLKTGDMLPGDEVFKLYDTFGLSKELIIDMAYSLGLSVDLEGYEKALERQRTQSKSTTTLKAGERENFDIYQTISPQPTKFLGYDYSYLTNDEGRRTNGDDHSHVEQSAIRNPQPAIGRVLGIIVNKEAVDDATQGTQVEVVLDQTPFYAESGGQVGDKGYLVWDGGRMEVQDTRRPVGGIIVHRGVILEGTLQKGAEVEAVVPGSVRWETMRNHTATHLVHKALRDVLGTHVHQAGSVVEPGRLRFDFHHNQQVTHEELTRIERIVNEQIRADYPVLTQETDYQTAVKEGAMALFGEKYGAVVRLVRIPGFESKELCGGTHVERTGQIGAFFITYEGSIGSGIRRIEAVTGSGAVEYAQGRRDTLERRGYAAAYDPGAGRRGRDSLARAAQGCPEATGEPRKADRQGRYGQSHAASAQRGWRAGADRQDFGHQR